MPQTFDTPLYSSDQSIDRVLKAGLPVLLVFLDGEAPAALDQAMKQCAQKDAGKLLVVQMHTKDSSETAKKYAIRSLPAVVAVKDGQLQSQAEAISPADLNRHADYLLGKGPKPLPQAQYTATGSSVGEQSKPVRPAAKRYGSQGAASSYPVTVTDATFAQEVMGSSIPVVVDFWAPWCGPCRMVAPVLDKLASEWSGRVKIAKVNVDENPRIAGQYGVQAIPTMLVVKGGKVIDRWAGALPEPAMRSRLSPVVS